MNSATTEIFLERHKQKRDYKTYMDAFNSLSNNTDYTEKLKKIEIVMLRNFTTEPLLPFFIVDLATFGIKLDVDLGGFDTVVQDAFEMDFEGNKQDFICVLNTLHNLSPILEKDFILYNSKELIDEIDRVTLFYKDLISELRKKTNATIIINNFPIPSYPLKGLADSISDPSQIDSILELNSKIKLLTREFENVRILDLFNTLCRAGSEKSIDPRMWKVSKNPFSIEGMSTISIELSRLIRAHIFTRKKCLILDCDNVLWNGVSGEEGIKSFNTEIQRMAINLHNTGVLIGLASKNDEKFVLDILESDDRNILKPKYLSAWKINWENKADNIKSISEFLNIGLDSVVFIDDSEYECELVKEIIPEVTVIKFEGNENLFCKEIILSGLFDAINLTDEDFKRSKMYKDSKDRDIILKSSHSYEDFLNNLEIEIEIDYAKKENLIRIQQLVQKTNQFNLTTIRYSESEINEIFNSGIFKIFVLRVRDKVSELGLVGVAFLKICNDSITIENLILSCRALGRGAEDAFMNVIKNYAVDQEFKKIVGRYVSSGKNDQVSGYFKRHDFLPSKNENNEYFEFDINAVRYSGPNYVKVLDNVKGKLDESK